MWLNLEKIKGQLLCVHTFFFKLIDTFYLFLYFAKFFNSCEMYALFKNFLNKRQYP